MHLRVGAGTDRGRVRTLNEDAYMLRAADGLFVVCDGMGGAPAGEVASQMAVDAIGRQMEIAETAATGSAPMASEYLRQTSKLAAAVRWSNAFIYDQAQKAPDQLGMGTTVVGAWIRHQIASVAHVGDSRAYLWRDDRLEPLTRDHSLAEAHVAAGGVDRAADWGGVDQNALMRVLGREPDVEVDVSEVPVQLGDYVLLCSDGLTRMVPEGVLATAIATYREPQRICDYLIAAANGNGGADNITVVVVEVADRWWRRLLNGWRGRPARRGEDVEAYSAV
jgi:PPM family protein phosphatase